VPRRYAVKIEAKERIVELDVDDGATRVRVDGAEVDVEIVPADGGLYVLRRGSEQTLAQVDGVGTKLVVSVRRPGADPVLVAAEVSDARRAKIAVPARAGADGAAPVTIRSPIPGRVVKVLVKVGDQVKAGQTLVVLEAMKMENELGAPRSGSVLEVRCVEGSAVEAGQDLVRMG
jgi:biotin carboxyl carrier protein